MEGCIILSKQRTEEKLDGLFEIWSTRGCGMGSCRYISWFLSRIDRWINLIKNQSNITFDPGGSTIIIVNENHSVAAKVMVCCSISPWNCSSNRWSVEHPLSRLRLAGYFYTQGCFYRRYWSPGQYRLHWKSLINHCNTSEKKR